MTRTRSYYAETLETLRRERVRLETDRSNRLKRANRLRSYHAESLRKATIAVDEENRRTRATRNEPLLLECKNAVNECNAMAGETCREAVRLKRQKMMFLRAKEETSREWYAERETRKLTRLREYERRCEEIRRRRALAQHIFKREQELTLALSERQSELRIEEAQELSETLERTMRRKHLTSTLNDVTRAIDRAAMSTTYRTAQDLMRTLHIGAEDDDRGFTASMRRDQRDGETRTREVDPVASTSRGLRMSSVRRDSKGREDSVSETDQTKAVAEHGHGRHEDATDDAVKEKTREEEDGVDEVESGEKRRGGVTLEQCASPTPAERRRRRRIEDAKRARDDAVETANRAARMTGRLRASLEEEDQVDDQSEEDADTPSTNKTETNGVPSVENVSCASDESVRSSTRPIPPPQDPPPTMPMSIGRRSFSSDEDVDFTDWGETSERTEPPKAPTTTTSSSRTIQGSSNDIDEEEKEEEESEDSFEW